MNESVQKFGANLFVPLRCIDETFLDQATYSSLHGIKVSDPEAVLASRSGNVDQVIATPSVINLARESSPSSLFSDLFVLLIPLIPSEGEDEPESEGDSEDEGDSEGDSDPTFEEIKAAPTSPRTHLQVRAIPG